MAATDLGAACDRFTRRPPLAECDIEALRSELVSSMASMCDEFGLVAQARDLRRAVMAFAVREGEGT